MDPIDNDDPSFKDTDKATDPLVEGVDYTFDPETGFMTFTEHYLLKRGYCCQSGCQNCPYGFTQPT